MSVFEIARTAVHHVGVDIDGIDGVGDRHGVVPAHQLANVARVTLGSVVDKNLIGVKMHAPWQEVVLYDSLSKPQVSLLGPIAVEGLLLSHVVDSLVHGLDDGRAERLRHVADAEADDLGLRMGGLEGIHFLGYVSEEIVLLQLQEMFVD